MAEFTIDDVRRILRECAGEAESVGSDADISDVTFEDMGYDSLALLEMASRIQQEFDVPIPDGAVEEMRTPGNVVVYVNSRTAAA
ncbi:acyl carrier protein [Actinoallomurus sp. NPDC052274]|uniref:acyl carrier protein n=1 Tax=Actinoallomurus sp. NPDC052274 TaxID=3155420 RepID=UPI003416F35E